MEPNIDRSMWGVIILIIAVIVGVLAKNSLYDVMGSVFSKASSTIDNVRVDNLSGGLNVSNNPGCLTNEITQEQKNQAITGVASPTKGVDVKWYKLTDSKQYSEFLNKHYNKINGNEPSSNEVFHEFVYKDEINGVYIYYVSDIVNKDVFVNVPIFEELETNNHPYGNYYYTTMPYSKNTLQYAINNFYMEGSLPEIKGSYVPGNAAAEKAIEKSYSEIFGREMALKSVTHTLVKEILNPYNIENCDGERILKFEEPNSENGNGRTHHPSGIDYFLFYQNLDFYDFTIAMMNNNISSFDNSKLNIDFTNFTGVFNQVLPSYENMMILGNLDTLNKYSGNLLTFSAKNISIKNAVIEDIELNDIMLKNNNSETLSKLEIQSNKILYMSATNLSIGSNGVLLEDGVIQNITGEVAGVGINLENKNNLTVKGDNIILLDQSINIKSEGYSYEANAATKIRKIDFNISSVYHKVEFVADDYVKNDFIKYENDKVSANIGNIKAVKMESGDSGLRLMLPFAQEIRSNSITMKTQNGEELKIQNIAESTNRHVLYGEGVVFVLGGTQQDFGVYFNVRADFKLGEEAITYKKENKNLIIQNSNIKSIQYNGDDSGYYYSSIYSLSNASELNFNKIGASEFGENAVTSNFGEGYVYENDILNQSHDIKIINGQIIKTINTNIVAY